MVVVMVVVVVVVVLVVVVVELVVDVVIGVEKCFVGDSETYTLIIKKTFCCERYVNQILLLDINIFK